jgi:DNA-binding NarL/FixJ family response regulator
VSVKILIADDHEVLREGLKSLLARARREWVVCGEASDGEQAVQLTQELKPDIVIMDISMPNMSGIEACERIRRIGVTPPILVFTTHEHARLFMDVRSAGAQGCVMKAQAGRDLVHAIDTLLSGGTFFGSPQAASEPENQGRRENDKPKPGSLWGLLVRGPGDYFYGQNLLPCST